MGVKHHSIESKKKIGESKTKRYAHIVKDGKNKNRQQYALVCDGIKIQRSMDIDKLKQHPIYNRTIDLSKYKCSDCIYAGKDFHRHTICLVFDKLKYRPQCCVMFNFNQKFWRSIG